MGAKVLGVVLNRVNLRSTDYHYGYRYYSNYYNNDDEKAAPNYASPRSAGASATSVRTGNCGGKGEWTGRLPFR